jgi:ubiquinone/menaquinone biosynthesis C-methylase UbiE
VVSDCEEIFISMNTPASNGIEEPNRDYQFYTRYYAAVAASRANAAYCHRLYGLNLCQHGFAEVAHIDQMMQICSLGPQKRVLDLGCGNGLIAEYISDKSGAHVTGIDFIPDAIRQAQERSRTKADRIHFQVMNMDHLAFPPQSFDKVLSIDTLYFIDKEIAIQQIIRLLKPGGKLCAFYSHGVDPEHPEEEFEANSLPPDKTPLGLVLQEHGLQFKTWDYSQADYEHALRKQKISEELKSEFEAEGNLFLYENHIDEAKGMAAAFEKGLHARYLYLVTTPE